MHGIQWVFYSTFSVGKNYKISTTYWRKASVFSCRILTLTLVLSPFTLDIWKSTPSKSATVTSIDSGFKLKLKTAINHLLNWVYWHLCSDTLVKSVPLAQHALESHKWISLHCLLPKDSKSRYIGRFRTHTSRSSPNKQPIWVILAEIGTIAS